MIKALIIVAHPDDETIWMGGMILHNHNWQWTILSLCRQSDKDREPKFRKVCEKYNAKSIILDLEDDKLESIDIDEIIKLIKENLADFEYDYIFTHGSNGEYGHIRHKETHQAVKNMIKNNILKCNKVYYFSYFKQIREAQADLSFKLTDKEFETKVRIIKEIYGFYADGFEAKACKQIERFDVEEIDNTKK